LFSLLSSRPLVAITQAIVVVSLIANLTASGFQLAHRQAYLAAAHSRILIALLVLAVDVYLGLHWLHRGSGRARRPGLIRRRPQSAAELRLEYSADTAEVRKLLRRRDRSAMLGHLFWQTWRQSAPTMALLFGMSIVLALAVRWEFSWQFNWGTDPTGFMLLLSVCVATIIGCFVFRADQERQHYRYFVEHNVPPRSVWLARQLPWLTLLAIAELEACSALLGKAPLLANWARLTEHMNLRGPNHFVDQAQQIDLWAGAAVWALLAAICYSAGQWASMFIRSGVIAGVVSVGLSLVLCVWMVWMIALGVNPLWSVLPIPLVLMISTWLRAPDWARENRRWSVRLRAAAVLVVPAVIVFVGVAIYRVRQIPLVSPGFDLGRSFAPLAAEAEATADLYRRANALRRDVEPWPVKQYVAANDEALDLVLGASRRPSPAFNDPRTSDDPIPWDVPMLNQLVITSGRELEQEGKLDEALKRFMAALRIGCQSGTPGRGFYRGGPEDRNGFSHSVFAEFADWAVQKGQTPARIREGVAQLQQFDFNQLWLDEQVEWWHVYARQRVLRGDAFLFNNQNGTEQAGPESFWLRLMPWEQQRALRMLDLITANSLEQLQLIRGTLANAKGITSYSEPGWWDASGSYNYFTPKADEHWRPEKINAEGKARWLATTIPMHLDRIGWRGQRLAADFTRFEVFRRATMISMALVSYRLEHGSLPATLDRLAGPYFHEVPLDPDPGQPFQRPYQYFPKGMPPSKLTDIGDHQDQQDQQSARIVPGTPGIWSEGTPWQSGFWFPIPEQQH
jgi:hypothetical protein